MVINFGDHQIDMLKYEVAEMAYLIYEAYNLTLDRECTEDELQAMSESEWVFEQMYEKRH